MNAEEKFGMIVEEYYKPLFRFAMSLTRNESDASDFTQQTFQTWALKGHQLRDETKVKYWLFTTLHRNFLQSRRREHRYTHHELETVSAELPMLPPEAWDETDGSLIIELLQRVSEPYRAAVALFYLQDWPYNEIAVVLDISIGTVKSRISRGIAQLRTLVLSGRDGTAAEPDATLVPATPGNKVRALDSYARSLPHSVCG